MGVSLVEEWAELTPEQEAEVLACYDETELDALWRSWEFHARPEQLAPLGLWRWWVIVTGRGWGKNRTGAEWVIDRCEQFAAAGMGHLVGLIGQNNDDVKALQIGGISGLREVVRRRGHRWIGADTTLDPKVGIQCEDGTEHVSVFEVHTAVEPEGPRGRNFHTLWADELAAYPHKTDAVGNTVFTNAELALRGQCPPGMEPAGCITTTPKPVPVIRDLLAGKHGPTHVTRGSMFDNRTNLPLSFLSAVLGKYGGSRLGDQEIHGMVVDSVEGALWHQDLIQNGRRTIDQVPDLSQIVVAVDPSGSDNGDECGIVVVGLARQRDHLNRQHVYVLDDLSCQNRPAVWSQVVIDAYRYWNADTVVAEVNFGAALVVDVIQIQAPNIPVEEVRASRGKRVRAEPVAILYDRGQARCHHVGVFPQLEEQMCFAAGTPVTTSDGVVPIEYVRPGALVPTREGWRPVSHAWCSGYRETVTVTMDDGRSLRCTPDHPIWTAAGWVEAAQLTAGTRLYECRELPSGPTSTIGASATTSMCQRAATSAPAAAEVAACSTATSTPLRSARSPRAGTSITATSTPATTTSGTSLLSPLLTTRPTTSYEGSLGGPANSTPPLLGSTGGAGNLGTASAGCVEPPSRQPVNGPLYVPGPVVSSVVANVGTEPVYDLEVEGCHEFAAAGLLVHNCFWTPLDPTSPDRMDALVWGVSFLIPDLTTAPSDYSKGLAERRIAA